MSSLINKLNRLGARGSQLRGLVIGNGTPVAAAGPRDWRKPLLVCVVCVSLVGLALKIKTHHSLSDKLSSSERSRAQEQERFNAATQFFKAKDYSKAYDIFLELSLANAKITAFTINLALAEHALKQNKGAEEHLEHLLSQGATDPEIYNNLAILLTEKGDLPGALQNLQTALKMRPDYPEAQLNRGQVNEQLKLFNEAITDYNAYLNRTSGDSSFEATLRDRVRRLLSLARTQKRAAL